MKLRFLEEGHKYESKPEINWTSVTRLIEQHHEHFDGVNQAILSSQNANSKWFGIEPSKINELWDVENKRSTDCGHWFHAMMEKRAIEAGEKLYRGEILKVKPPIYKPGYKLAREQELENGIYPEHIVYNERAKVCGQVDLPYVCNGIVDIDDYKTNKKISFRGYQNKMMRGALSHLPDCNFIHYALQLSIYMKLILLKNPSLKPGRLRIIHVEFEKEGKDEFGFPILKKHNIDYIVKNKTAYELPYLEKEVNYMLVL